MVRIYNVCVERAPQMQMFHFVRSNTLPSLWLGIGAFVSVWGFVTDARDIVTLGVQADYIQLSGFLIFAFGVITVLHRQHQVLETRLSGSVPTMGQLDRATVQDAPPLKPDAPEALPVPAETLPVPARTPKRDYLPASFSDIYIQMHRDSHTDIERTSILRPHVGKWIRLSGYVGQIIDNGDRIHVLVRPDSSDGNHFSVNFPPEAEPLLAKLKSGMKISFDALISNKGWVGLREAELL